MWVAIGVAALATVCFHYLPSSELPYITWKRVLMDGHRTGAQSVTSENACTAFGAIEGDVFVTPSGAAFELGSPVTRSAELLISAQSSLSGLKHVVAHSACTLPNLRTQPDLPLANMMTDALREGARKHFKRPVDFAMLNYGGIRCPLPEGPVTLEDIESMFPFKNYLVLVRMKGSDVRSMFEKLAGTKAFIGISGAAVHIVDHQLKEVMIGGKPLEDKSFYNVATIDFLLLGGDNVVMIPSQLWSSTVLVKDVVLDYVSSVEASGQLLDAASDGRVIME